MNKFFLSTSIVSFVTLISSLIGSAYPSVNYSLVKENQIQLPQGFTHNQGGVKQDFILAQIILTQNSKAEANKLFQQAEQQFRLAECPKALQTYQQVLEIRRQLGDKAEIAQALNKLGEVYSCSSKYPEALKVLEEALKIAKELRNSQIQGETTDLIGQVYSGQQKYPKALETLQQALILRQEAKDRVGEARTLTNIGSVYLNLNQLKKALEILQQALKIQQSIKDNFHEAETLSLLGVAYIRSGKQEQGLDLLTQGLTLSRKVGHRLAEGSILFVSGFVYFEMGKLDQAMVNLELGLPIIRQTKNKSDESFFLALMLRIYQKQGKYQEVLDIGKELLAVARERNNRPLERQILSIIAAESQAQGQSASALEYFQQALVLAQELKQRDEEGEILFHIAGVNYGLGQYPKALQLLQQALSVVQRQALEINKKIKNRSGQVVNINNIGNVYLNAQQYQKALDYYQEALVISKEIKNPTGEATNINNIGMVYDELEQYQKALEYYQQALAFNQKLKNRYEEAINLNNIGGIYDSLKQYQKALNFNQQALVIAKEVNNLHLQGLTKNSIGTTYLLSGNPAEAEKHLYEAINIWESLRGGRLEDENQITLFQNQFKTYQTLQQVLIALNKREAALEIAERGRARAFVNLLVSKLSEKEVKLESIKAPNIEQIKEIARQKKATIVQYSIVQDEVKTQGKYRERDLYIWVIKPTGEVVFRQVDLAKFLSQQQNISLKDLVTTTRDSVGVRSIFQSRVLQPEENPTKRLQQLHQLLIAPISDLLPTDQNQRVIFVPQGGLFLVPFPALQDAQGKYLIEKHTILTSPSIQVLELTQKQRERVQQISAQDAIVVGNPTMPKLPPEYGEGELTPLAGAKKEAEVIAHMLNTKALIGKEATETAVKAKLSRAKIIHLATHGLFDDIQGLRSALAFAPSEKDNGLLTAEEILDQKLNADLVVLSACDTARGRITGDGVIGLSRSLISVGTPSVIVSLWAVPDAPTAELMKEFYTNMFEKKLDKAQALRQAMLKFKDKSPKNWAAFTLIGEP